jgi:hypothetical protein
MNIKKPQTLEEWEYYFKYESFKAFGYSDEQITSVLKKP